MKRVIALLLMLALLVGMVGCASKEDRAEAKEVKMQIEELGEVSLKDADKVGEIQEDYDDLSEEAQKLVKNKSVLDEAHQTIANIVMDMIDEIGTVTLDSEAKIDEAQAAYDSLHEDTQDLVDNYKTLEKAEEELLSVFTDSTNTLTNVIDAVNAAMDECDVLSVLTLIDENLPLAEKLMASKYYVNTEDDIYTLFVDIRDLMGEACYPNTHIVTLDNFIELQDVYNAKASSNEGESINTEDDTGMDYHTYMYTTATRMANAFIAYTEYLSKYFTIKDVTSDGANARYLYTDDLGREFFAEWAVYDLGSYGTYYWITVGFAPEVGLAAHYGK